MFKLPSHLTISTVDGHLYDTRTPEWYHKPPLREDYRRLSRLLVTTSQLRASLRAAAVYGEPVCFLMADGQFVCEDCARREYKLLSAALRAPLRCDQWRPTGAYPVNDLSRTEHCAHCDIAFTPDCEEE